MVTDRGDILFSGDSNMLSTFLRCDVKSGAVRRRPDVLFDEKESAVSLKSARPLSNILKVYYDESITPLYYHTPLFFPN